MNRIGLSISLLFTAVICLYLVILFSGDEGEQAVIDEASIKPTYRAINLNSKLYDDAGRLSHQVEAKSMEHYQPLGFMVFEYPLYTVYLEESAPWQVTAEEGTLYENNRIQLERNVKIVNMNDTDYVKQISTDYIEINLNDKTLSSDSRVVITGDSFNVQSIGIKGNLTTQQYKLTQNVQTTFSN